MTLEKRLSVERPQRYNLNRLRLYVCLTSCVSSSSLIRLMLDSFYFEFFEYLMEKLGLPECKNHHQNSDVIVSVPYLNNIKVTVMHILHGPGCIIHIAMDSVCGN